MKIKSKDPIDRAVATLVRRLAVIKSNASGMPWYSRTACRCNAIEVAIREAQNPKQNPKSISIGKSIGMMQIEELEAGRATTAFFSAQMKARIETDPNFCLHDFGLRGLSEEK